MYKVTVEALYPSQGISKTYPIYTEGKLSEVEASLEIIERQRLEKEDGLTGFKPSVLKIIEAVEIEGIVA